MPDAPGADMLVVVCADGRVVMTEDFEVEAAPRYDATRSLGHVRFHGGARPRGRGRRCRGRAGTWHRR